VKASRAQPKEAMLQDREELRRELQTLLSEHRDLDDVIERISDAVPFDQLQVQRLKKRKLILKDQITRLQALLLPDIIA
jgi:hypothetical protein